MDELTIDERNGKLTGLVNQMRTVPKIGVGDIVECNDLGAALNDLFVPGERFYVAAVGEVIGKFAGDPSRTIELWSFAGDGSLRRTITDPRFLRVVERFVKKAAVTS